MSRKKKNLMQHNFRISLFFNVLIVSWLFNKPKMFEIEITGEHNEVFRINLDDIDVICRLCLKKEGTITLFDTKDQKNVGGKFKELLSFLSLLQVDKHDGLPHKICRNCASLINEFYLFKEQINTTQVVLYIALGKIDVDKSKMNDINLKQLNTSNGRPDDISEEIETYDDKITPVKIEQGTDISITPVKIEQGIDISDEESESLNTEEYINDFVQVIGGEMLEQAEKTKKELEHVPEGDERIYKCPLCKETFSERKEFLRHRNRERDRSSRNAKKVICTACGKAVVKDRLDDHMNSHTKNRPHICDICGKGFRSRPNLYTHKVRHREVKPHICEICGRGFVHAGKLKDHLRAHRKEFSFMCDICGCSTVTKEALRRHQKFHRLNKEFYPQTSQLRFRKNFYPKETYCEICKKDYKTGQRLAIHMYTHSGERPFKCSVCNKAFTQHGHLRYHERLHTGEKPHTCQLCGKAFTLNGNLQQHIKTHTGEKPYNCEICDKAFITNSSLRKHRKVHDKEERIIYKEESIVYSDTEYTVE